jgi:hypothetical protein
MLLYLQVPVMWYSLKHGTTYSLTSHLFHLSVASGWSHSTNGALSTMDFVSFIWPAFGMLILKCFYTSPAGLCLPTFDSSPCWTSSSYHSGKGQLEHFSVCPIKVITQKNLKSWYEYWVPHEDNKFHLFSIIRFKKFEGGESVVLLSTWSYFDSSDSCWPCNCCDLCTQYVHWCSTVRGFKALFFSSHKFTSLVVGLCWSVCRPLICFSTQLQLTLS